MYNKHNLAVAKFAYKSDIKPELASVLFTKTHTVATDTFRLLEMSVPNDVADDDFPTFGRDTKAIADDGVLIDASQVSKIKLPKSKELPIINNAVVHDVDDTFAEILTTDEKLDALDVKRVKKVSGNYPTYKNIIPMTEPVASVRVNGKYLAEILEALGDMNDFNVVTLELRWRSDPIVVRANNSKNTQEGLGLVMPINK